MSYQCIASSFDTTGDAERSAEDRNRCSDFFVTRGQPPPGSSQLFRIIDSLTATAHAQQTEKL